MANGQGILSAAFKAVAAASSAALLASSLTFGIAPAFAQDFGRSVPVATAAAEPAAVDGVSYRHSTLASTSTAPVGIQLVLAMDTSSSMSNEEWAIQSQATAQALNSEIVRSVIKYKGGDQSIAIAVLDFDHTAAIRIPWVDIRGEDINDRPYQPGQPESSAAPDKLDMLAQEIATLSRPRSGSTEFEPAMRIARDLFLNSPWQVTERRILDLFSDGSESGFERQRQELIDLGVTINAFAVLNEAPQIEDLYKRTLITTEFNRGADGIYSEPGRVWAVARNLQAEGNQAPGLKSFFGEVTSGMRQKISVEVAGLDTYQRVLAMLDTEADFPVPSLN